MHTGKNYSGYALTYMGYDYLALKVFIKRGYIRKVLCKIGTGKESDIYICEAGKGPDEVERQKNANKQKLRESRGEEADPEVKKPEDAEESNFTKEGYQPGDSVVIKFARLGRTSFRSIKNNRDYLKGRHASWLYMSRIASLKEFAFMKALHKHGFPTPIPLEANRHGICMNLIRAYPMGQVKGLTSAEKTYHDCIA